MKKTVRIFSALLAVMMICMTFAVTAGAAEENTLTLKSEKVGFTFSIFKIADVNTTTGAFTVNDSLAATQKAKVNELLSVVKTTDTELEAKSKAVATYLDGEISGLAKDAQTAILGSAVATFAVTDEHQSETFTTLADGIYYVVALSGDTPANVTKNQGSIITLPEYNTTTQAWNRTVEIVLNGKVSSGEVDVDKTIVASDKYTTSTNKDAAITDETTPVTFELSASVVGSKEQPLKTYIIGDNMDDGLTYVKGQTPVVKLVKGETEVELTASQYTVNTSTPSYDGGKYSYTFAVELAPSVFDKDAIHGGLSFYDYEKVVVQYQATINENVVVKEAENNTDYLLYQNNGGSFTEVAGDTVKVYTLGVDIMKYDAATEAKTKLAGAEFALYTSDGTLVAKAISTTTGNDKFYVLDAAGAVTENEYNVKPGSYVIKETKAPAGYTLNTADIPVTVAADFTTDGINPTDADGYFSYECGNTPIILPATGGAGTIMFTIVGAVLISFAGVLFFVLMRKKNATK